MEADPWRVLKDHKYLLIIIGVGLIVYFNMLFNGFVWDDNGYKILVTQPGLGSLLNPLLLQGERYYRPLFIVYFVSLYGLFGQAFLFHLIQLILHITNGILLMLFMKKFFPKQVAFIIALIFLIHPMQTETVSYISAFSDTFSFFLGICVLLILTKKQLDNRSLLVSSILLFLNLITKESAIIFFILPIIYIVLFNKRSLKKILLAEACSFLFFLLIRFLFFPMHLEPFSFIPIVSASIVERFYTIPAIFWHYILTFFFPATLAIDQQWVVRSVTLHDFIFPLLGDMFFILLFVLFTFFLFKKHRNDEQKVFGFFLSWFVLGMGIYLQVIPLDMTVADRWFYVPIVGLLGVGAIMYLFFEKKLPKVFNPFFLLIGLIVVFALSARTIIRNTNFVDDLTLYSHDARLTQSFSLENNLATVLDSMGQYKDSLIHEQKSVKLHAYEGNVNNLGATYEHLGNLQLAKKYYLESLQYPNQVLYNHLHGLNIYTTVGVFLAEQSDPKEAVDFLRNALSDFPNAPDLWLYLAIAQYRLKNYPAAEQAITAAYLMQPNPNITYARYQIEHKLPITLINQHGNGKPIIIQ